MASFDIEVMPVSDIVHGTVWDAQDADGEIKLSSWFFWTGFGYVQLKLITVHLITEYFPVIEIELTVYWVTDIIIDYTSVYPNLPHLYNQL